MRISQIKNAEYIGEFKIRNDQKNPNLLKFNYAIDALQQKKKDPRVYIFVSGSKIMKIGGSGDSSGIKGTLSFYENAFNGSPGRPRFIGHHLIHEELTKGKKVKVYAIYNQGFKHTIKTLAGNKSVMIYTFFKEIEKECLREFKEHSGHYPDWNFQENHKAYPAHLEDKFNKMRRTKTRKKK